MMHKKTEKSFTVVELLIVIGIIGLLATIVIVSLKFSRKKADYAKLLSYSSSVKNSIGSGIVGEWNFSEGSGGTINDSTNGENDSLYWVGTNSHWDDNDITELGKTGVFSINNHLQSTGLLPLDSKLNIKNKITMEAWFKALDNASTILFVNRGGAYYLVYQGGLKQFEIGINNGSSTCGWAFNKTGASSTEPEFTANEWHHIVASFKDNEYPVVYLDTTQLKFKYMNGACGGQNVWTLTPDYSSLAASLQIGIVDSSPSNVYLDGIRVYNEYIGP